ncbi:MAG TPA: thioredoxin-dependent thiol peroxidase [Crocinitomicaceae bacterium]|nr:thioredoxin-dependent thiol peroxidase [Crocinitomicaceae bacterium]
MFQLKVGDKAPLFKGLNQYGKEVDTATLVGKKYVIYFYPKDSTPGCTAQACSIRDGEQQLKAKGITVLGISADSVASHERFSTKQGLNFDIISDESKTILNLYGVFGPKKFMGREYDGIHRTTFVIDEQNTIIEIIRKPNTSNHAQEILEIYENN